MMRKIERENTGRMKPGQELVVAGYAGLAGSLMAAAAKRDQLVYWFSREYLEDFQRLEEAVREWPRGFFLEESFREKAGATECEPCGEGGILRTIWDLSGAYETGVEFALRKIPIRQETVEICEWLELNPYRLYSRGCYLLAAENGGALVEELARRQIPAGVIGRVNRGISREMTIQEGAGFLERPQRDELYRIIPDFQAASQPRGHAVAGIHEKNISGGSLL